MGYNKNLVPLVNIFYIVFQEDDKQTFNFIVNYISSKNLKGVFMKQAYELKLRNFIMDKLIADF